MSGTQTREYKKLQETFDTVISHLGAVLTAEELSHKLFAAKLITNGTREQACVAGVANSKRMRILVVAVLAQVQIRSENYQTFLSVLGNISGVDDILDVMKL